MAIIIREIIKGLDKKYYLENYHSSPFYINGKFNDIGYYLRLGRLKELDGLEVNKLYQELNDTDFEIIERIPQQLQDDGLVYDSLFYKKKMNKI